VEQRRARVVGAARPSMAARADAIS